MKYSSELGQLCYASSKGFSAMVWMGVALIVLSRYHVQLSKVVAAVLLFTATFGNYWFGYREAKKVLCENPPCKPSCFCRGKKDFV